MSRLGRGVGDGVGVGEGFWDGVGVDREANFTVTLFLTSIWAWPSFKKTTWVWEASSSIYDSSGPLYINVTLGRFMRPLGAFSLEVAPIRILRRPVWLADVSSVILKTFKLSVSSFFS